MSKNEDSRDVWDKIMDGNEPLIGGAVGSALLTALMRRKVGLSRKALQRLRQEAVNARSVDAFRAKQRQIYERHGIPKAQATVTGVVVGGSGGALGGKMYQDARKDRRK